MERVNIIGGEEREREGERRTLMREGGGRRRGQFDNGLSNLFPGARADKSGGGEGGGGRREGRRIVKEGCRHSSAALVACIFVRATT